MRTGQQEDDSSGASEAILILRLVVDSDARLRRGELLDANADSLARFADFGGLTAALRGWLDRQRLDQPPASGVAERP